MRRKELILPLLLALAPVCRGQMLDPARLKQPPTDMWPTYHGDYTGRRYSPLKQIDSSNVKGLTLAWIWKTNSISDGAKMGGSGPEPSSNALATVKGEPLMVNGVLYLTAANQGWAVDARTGRQLWHYMWRGVPAFNLGNRGFGMSGDWLFFETADNYLVSLEAKTGKERWNKQMADVKRDYFSSLPPLIVKNHVITGVGGDFLDVPNFAEARDPETGDVQWHFWTTAHQGDPGFSTWPNAKAVEHGGGGIWIPPTYDPELNLLYLGTGNVNPVMAGHSRTGDNLYTCSVVALNADTGKLVWHFQYSPHDTHDWDAAQVPVLFDGAINGQPRKLLAQAYRGGLFFVLDRTNGKSVLTTPMVDGLNWYKGIAPNGQPIRDPGKEPTIPGSLVSPASGGVTNWPSPSFNPDTGLFYVGTSLSYAIFYLTDADPQPEGYGGAEAGVGNVSSSLRAIDYKTGKVVWQHKTGNGAQGLLSTAGNLLFGSDGYGNFIAFDAKTGDPLWHAGLLANPTNAPQTYMLDGRQYVAVGAGEYLYTFVLQD
jgi:acido-empty-quinoprotein group A